MEQAVRVYLPNPRVAYRNIGGQTVIVQPLDNRLLRLNETGTTIWDSLDGRTVEQIAARVADSFEVGADQALLDVAEFLDYLHQRGLLTLAPGPSDEDTDVG